MNGGWPKDGYDLRNSRCAGGIGLSIVPKLKWNIVKGGWYAAAGPDGTIYTSYNSVLYALDPVDGAIKWQYGVLSGATTFYRFTVDSSDNVYLVYTDNTLRCVDSTGTLVWQFNDDYDRGLFGTPTIDGAGNVYIYGGKAITGGTTYYLIKVDSAGSEVWACEVATIYSGGFGFSGITIALDGTIIADCLGYVRGITTGGSVDWSYGFIGDPVCCPAIASDGTILALRDTTLYALNSDGTLLWNKSIGTTAVGVAVSANDIIYVVAYRNLYSIDLTTGDINWQCAFTSEFDVDAYGPAVDSAGIVYVCFSTKLYAIGADNTILWEHSIGYRVIGPPTIDTLGHIYYGVQWANLLALSVPVKSRAYCKCVKTLFVL
jgi:hypothetical protein